MIKNRYLPTITDKPWWLAGGITPANCVVAWQPKGATSLSASKINLANPGTYDLIDAGGTTIPSFSPSIGWSFDGQDDYLYSTVIPNLNYTWSMLVSCSDVNTDSKAVVGVGGAGIFCFYILRSSATKWQFAHKKYTEPLSTLTGGIFAISGTNGFINGGSKFAMSTSGWDGVARAVYVGALNADNTPTYFGKSKVHAISIYNVTITDTQVAAVTNAMQAL